LIILEQSHIHLSYRMKTNLKDECRDDTVTIFKVILKYEVETMDRTLHPKLQQTMSSSPITTEYYQHKTTQLTQAISLYKGLQPQLIFSLPSKSYIVTIPLKKAETFYLIFNCKKITYSYKSRCLLFFTVLDRKIYSPKSFPNLYLHF
jgi:hypothetical protein